MNISHLEAVQLVAQYGSVSRASAVSGVAQSALSRSISIVESEWGQRLFERTGRGLVLTEGFGAFMLPDVERLLAQWKQLHTLAQERAEGLRGTVRVAIAPSLVPVLVRPLLNDVSVTHPEVRISFKGGPTATLEEQVRAKKLDVALLVRYPGQHHPDEEFLTEVQVYLVCKGDAPLARMDALPTKDLFELPLVLPSRPNAIRAYLDGQAQRHGVQVHVAVEADAVATLKEIVLSGVAYAILPFSAVKDEVASGALRAVRIEDPPMMRRIMLATGTPATSATRFVANRLRKLVTGMAAAQTKLS